MQERNGYSRENDETSEARIVHDTAATLKVLHENIDRANLREALDIANSGNFNPEYPLKEMDALKLEMNAISALFIQELWENMATFIEENPPGFGRSLHKPGELAAIIPYTADEIQVMSRHCKLVVQRPVDAMSTLTQRTSDTLHTELEMLCNRHEAALNSPEEELTDTDKAYRRYKTLLTKHPQAQVYSLYGPKLHIAPGVNTAIQTIRDLFSVIPAVYKREHGYKASPEDVQRLAQESLSLIQIIATAEINLFADMDAFITRDRNFGYGPASFVLREKNGRERLEVNSEVFHCLSFRSSPHTLRTGCPALVARGTHGKNVIAELHQWHMDLAKQHYFPNVDRYVAE